MHITIEKTRETCAPTLSTDPLPVTQLPVMEQFYTIQGEGFHQGKAAYFIRLAGCNVGCHWCDVKDSWDASSWPKQSIEDIVNNAKEQPSRLVVITGGEPLMHQLDGLCTALKEAGFDTHMETSGANPLSGRWDWICLSPKKFKSPLPDVLYAANELKVVVFNKSDFAWAEKHAALVGEDCLLYLQPEWSQSDKMLPLMVEYVKKHPQWRICLQTHKFMDIP